MLTHISALNHHTSIFVVAVIYRYSIAFRNFLLRQLLMKREVGH